MLVLCFTRPLQKWLASRLEPDGIEVHYRPQAAVTKADIEAAWAMIQKLRGAVLRPELTVEDRKERKVIAHTYSHRT